MNAERRKILEMLAHGKITAEDAERLIEKLAVSEDADPYQEGEASETGHPPRPRYLRILVNSTSGDKVNIRVPIALVRTGLKLSTMLPASASEKLAAKGIDLGHLGHLQGEELIEALRELTVDVSGSDGDTVRIFTE